MCVCVCICVYVCSDLHCSPLFVPLGDADILPSPVLQGYRNKNSFTIGFSHAVPPSVQPGSLAAATSLVPCIGFALGRMQDGVFETAVRATEPMHLSGPSQRSTYMVVRACVCRILRTA